MLREMEFVRELIAASVPCVCAGQRSAVSTVTTSDYGNTERILSGLDFVNNNQAFIVQHKFTRSKSYYIDDNGKAKADPKQLRWNQDDSEVMELALGAGVYIKIADLVNVFHRSKNAVSAARRLLVCVFNDQTLMERSVKGSPDRPGLCPITHQAILDCVDQISHMKPADWAADETMINRSLIVRLCELRSKRTSKIYVTSQTSPLAFESYLPMNNIDFA